MLKTATISIQTSHVPQDTSGLCVWRQMVPPYNMYKQLIADETNYINGFKVIYFLDLT
ncbi:MAG: hypothetical protein H8E54_12490 [Candidatus Aminicenantes bacterium]|nr:hypothetical protein [Candidatus Aminicenantes bacterium]